VQHQSNHTTGSALVAANPAAAAAAAAAAAGQLQHAASNMAASGMLMSHSPQNHQQVSGCVMMVYGLDPEKMNCDRLFNMFCLYGNVIRVRPYLLFFSSTRYATRTLLCVHQNLLKVFRLPFKTVTFNKKFC
jgi:hypothetical protein